MQAGMGLETHGLTLITHKIDKVQPIIVILKKDSVAIYCMPLFGHQNWDNHQDDQITDIIVRGCEVKKFLRQAAVYEFRYILVNPKY